MQKTLKYLSLVMMVCWSMLALPALAGQPDWVAGESADYPSANYLTGRGVGSTEDEAKNRARGDLATIFEVRIQVQTENTTSVARSGKQEQVNQMATQRVSARSDKVISGVSVPLTWRDPVTKDFHALAILSRAQAAAGLRDEIGRIDDEVQQQVDKAKAATDPLLGIAALAQAQSAFTKRDAFEASLKVVNPSGHGIDPPIAQSVVQDSLGAALKRVHIAPEVADDGGEAAFAALLKGGVAAAGFLANSKAEADLLLVGKLALSDLGRQANWNWVRATVEVSLVERDSGRVRGSKTWPVKASAQDAATAKARALMEVEKLFKRELRTAIIGFASN